MSGIRHGFFRGVAQGLPRELAVISIVTALAVQGCSLAPKLPDPEEKHAVLERWNRCLQRFESNKGHFCDGHRRDVLATYPAHLEPEVDALLRRQVSLVAAQSSARSKTRSNARAIMKTGLHNPRNAVLPGAPGPLPGAGSKAE